VIPSDRNYRVALKDTISNAYVDEISNLTVRHICLPSGHSDNLLGAKVVERGYGTTASRHVAHVRNIDIGLGK